MSLLDPSATGETPPALHSVSVAAAITDDQGRFLIIQRSDNGRWEPPGGVLERDENIHEGLTREVEEETGLQVEPTALTGVYKNMRRAIVALVFRCRVVGGELQAGHECRALSWTEPRELAFVMAEAYVVRLTDALQTGSPSIRPHDGERLL